MRVDLRNPAAVTCGDRAVTVTAPDVVTVVGGGPARSVRIPGLDASDVAFVACGAGDVFVVGETTPELWVVRLDDLAVRRVAVLDRLDFAGGYDPGGLHRVVFHALPGDNVLVEYEVGLALLGEGRTKRWELVHDDLTARVVVAGDDTVTVDSENGRYAVRLADGERVPSG